MKTGSVSARMYQTRIDLPETTRRRSIEIFNQLLASCLDLYSQAKQAHWNVKGKDFYQVHILFDDVATAVFDPIDLLAERITTLGGIAHGTVMDASENSAIPPYPDTETMNETDHLNALAERLAVFAKQVRAALDRTASWNDQASSDICTEISRVVDQKLWFVEAHLQESRVRSLTA